MEKPPEKRHFIPYNMNALLKSLAFKTKQSTLSGNIRTSNYRKSEEDIEAYKSLFTIKQRLHHSARPASSQNVKRRDDINLENKALSQTRARMRNKVRIATIQGKRNALAEINTDPKLQHETFDSRDSQRGGTRRNSRRIVTSAVAQSDRLPRRLNMSRSSQNVSEKTGHIPASLITPINKNYRVSYDEMKQDAYMKDIDRHLNVTSRPPRMPRNL